MDYVALYATTLLVSFILTLIFFLFHSKYWNSATHIPLQIIYFLNMASALLCIVWVIVDGKAELRVINYIANIIEFNCMGYCGFCWLRYCVMFVNVPWLQTKSAHLLMYIPIGIVTMLILTSPITHWLFYIDDNGYFHRGPFYFVQQTGYLYLCISSVICLLCRKRSTNTRTRRRLTVLSMFPLSPAVFGSIQIIAPSGSAPTLQVSILISLILVFVDELDQKITRDSLTQLKNRYEFERILQLKMENFQKSGPKLYVFISDLNGFKSINDNYGHLEGDNALSVVGRVMTDIQAKYHAVCARMGGDEFLSMIETNSYEKAEAFRAELENNLTQACSDLPYTLQLSTGIAEYDGSMTLMQLISEADAKMYEQKKILKCSR